MLVATRYKEADPEPGAHRLPLTSLLDTSATRTSGNARRRRARIAGSSTQATGWLAVIRRLPETPTSVPETLRASWSAPASMARAESASRGAFGVGTGLRPVRSNSTTPTFETLSEMRYLWRRLHQLVNTRMQALIGPEQNTPFVAAVRGALADLGFLTAPALRAVDPRAAVAG